MLLPVISCSPLILPACLFVCTSVSPHEPLAYSPSSASHPCSELGQGLTLLDLVSGFPHTSILQSFCILWLSRISLNTLVLEITGTIVSWKTEMKTWSFCVAAQWHRRDMASPRPLTWKVWVRVYNCVTANELFGAKSVKRILLHLLFPFLCESVP